MFGDTPADQQQSDDQTNTVPGLGLGTNPDFSTGAISEPTVSDPLANSSSGDDTQTDSSAPIIKPDDDSSSKDKSDDNNEATDSSSSSELDEIKKQALSQLSPLVHKLDQSPEEKYRTLIMLVQASDNKDLLSEAYEAAQKITDEKAKAEALLTIVNEINYFDQK